MEFLGDEKQRDLCLKGPQELDELMRLLIDLKRRSLLAACKQRALIQLCPDGSSRARVRNTSSTPGARVVAAAAAAQRRKIGFS
jgi:hypothetical protein